MYSWRSSEAHCQRVVVQAGLLATAMLCACPDTEVQDAGSGHDSGAVGDGGGAGDVATGVDAGAADRSSAPDLGAVGDLGPGWDCGTSGVDAAVPVLERAARDERSCSLARPVEALGEPQWWGSELVAAASGFAVARVIQDAAGYRVVFSTVELDGSLGVDREVAATSEAWPMSPSMVVHGDGFALVWAEWGSEQQWLRFARLDATGAVVTGPHEVADTRAQVVTAPRLASAGEHLALVWGAGGYSQQALRFAMLDDQGAAVSSPRDLTTASAIDRPAVAALAGGYAIGWAQHESGGWGAWVMRLAESGAAAGAPQRLSRSGYSASPPSLLAVADGLFASWSESYMDYDNQEGYAVVLLARLDAMGRSCGPAQLLQAPALHRENIQPVLLEMGQHLGLLWSHGSLIYICAGCMPDNDLSLAVLDRRDLVPVAPVLSIPHPGGMPGLLYPRPARAGADILLTCDITYHVSSSPASAALLCP